MSAPDWDLSGSVAVVTGAARGIGVALAEGLAGMGAAVALVDIDGDGAREVAERLASEGRRTAAFRADVTRWDEVDGLAGQIETRLGPPAIVVNNAGWDSPGPFLQSSVEAWRPVLAVNLEAPILVCRRFAPGLAERAYGRIVNVVSDAGRVGSSGEAVYSAAKGGVIAFTKALARELARTGVTANCVAPGPTETPLLAQVTTAHPHLGEALLRAIPMRRFGRPDDVAAAVCFLAGPWAAYITGQTLSVSGGLTMA